MTGFGQGGKTEEAGCEVVFQESISTRTAEKDRAQLQAALSAVMETDLEKALCIYSHALSK